MQWWSTSRRGGGVGGVSRKGGWGWGKGLGRGWGKNPLWLGVDMLNLLPGFTSQN